MLSLDPRRHLHPAKSGPLPPWGSDTCVRCACNWPTWNQTSRALCLHGAQTPGPGVRAPGVRGGNPGDPSGPNPRLQRSTFSSIRKGVPLYAWKNMGRPPGDGFSPSSGGQRSGQDLSRPYALRLPITSFPGSSDPPFRCHSSFTGSLGTCPFKQKPSLPPRRRRDFSGATLPSSTPTPHRHCAQDRLGDQGLGGDFPGNSLRAR